MKSFFLHSVLEVSVRRNHLRFPPHSVFIVYSHVLEAGIYSQFNGSLAHSTPAKA